MATLKDLIREIRSKRRTDAKNRWWVAELLAIDCEKSVDSHRMGGYHAEMARMAEIHEEG